MIHVVRKLLRHFKIMVNILQKFNLLQTTQTDLKLSQLKPRSITMTCQVTVIWKHKKDTTSCVSFQGSTLFQLY